MDTAFKIIQLLLGVALFLFGMNLMGDGLKRVAGDTMQMVLYKMTKNPIKGLLLGTVVTMVIQSSSATSIMIIGFVNAGMMQLGQAIGVIMGANIGTSITGWILALPYMDGSANIGELLSTQTIAGVFGIIGIVMTMAAKKQSQKDVGYILLGFTVLMVGMQTISGAVAFVKESPFFLDAMAAGSNPVIGILIGFVFTLIIQSSSAGVGILQALSTTGTITFSSAFPIIMGIGVGAACPVLIAAFQANREGRRTGLAYLNDDLMGMLICGSGFYIVNAISGGLAIMDITMTPVTIALLNSVYRIATVLILFPFIRVIEKVLYFIVKKDPSEGKDNKDFEMLSDSILPSQRVAMENGKAFISRYEKLTWNNITLAFTQLWNYTEAGIDRCRQACEELKEYNSRINKFLTKLCEGEMEIETSRELTLLLDVINELSKMNRVTEELIELLQQTNGCIKSEMYNKQLIDIMDNMTELHDLFIHIHKNRDQETLDMVMEKRSTYEALYADFQRSQMEQIVNGRMDVADVDICIKVREILAGMNDSVQHIMGIYFTPRNI